MNAQPLSTEASPKRAAAPDNFPSAREIDTSCRVSVSLFVLAALFWLLAGVFLLTIASIKLHAPGFLADSAFWTYGRIRPLAMNSLLYGFASQAAFGVSVWLLARLGKTVVRSTALLMIGAVFWNLALVLGLAGIAAGYQTGYEWLEIPKFASPLLFASYVIIGCGALGCFATRQQKALYVSQWFLLGAWLWFPWIYSTAQMLLVITPVRGSLQLLVNGWFAENVFDLWIVPVGLATLFYFIPKLTNLPLRSRHLAAFAFWLIALLGPFGGIQAGAPLPKWLSSVSIASNVLMLVPLCAVFLILHQTLAGNYRTAWQDGLVRFFLAGAFSLLLAGALSAVFGLRSVAELSQFTSVSLGMQSLQLFGVAGMTFSGAVYFILPRVLGVNWPCPNLARYHFWLSGAGLVLTSVPLILGGLMQGAAFNDPAIPFIQVVRKTVPFLGMNTLGVLLTFFGYCLMAVNLIQIFRVILPGCCGLGAASISQPKASAASTL